MTTVAQAMGNFLAEIRPSEYQANTLIPARRRTVTENLESTFPVSSDMPFESAYLMGSAAKGTIIRPIDDVDVMAVFSNENGAYAKYRYDSTDFLYRIRRAYNGLSIQQVGARGQAVRVFFKTGGHVDVAPMFHEYGDNYLLPAGNGSWIRTSPLKANAWFSKRNQELSSNLRPLVQLLKKWNREHSSRLRSFHLETVAATIFSDLGSVQRNNLTSFFGLASNRLAVSDPGGHSADLSGYLDWRRREDVRRSLASSEAKARRAISYEASGDHTEAKRLWRIILGTDFPS